MCDCECGYNEDEVSREIEDTVSDGLQDLLDYLEVEVVFLDIFGVDLGKVWMVNIPAVGDDFYFRFGDTTQPAKHYRVIGRSFELIEDKSGSNPKKQCGWNAGWRFNQNYKSDKVFVILEEIREDE